MSFNQKNILGLLAGIVGLAAIKSATGSKSTMTMHYHHAKQCLDDAHGNPSKAKQICRQRYANESQQFVHAVCEAIDHLASGQGSKSTMTMHYHYAQNCLDKADGNVARAKRICRQMYPEHYEIICEAIDHLTSGQGSMAKIPQGKDGFSREQDLAYFRYRMSKPKFAGTAPDFSERNAKMSELQEKMRSTRSNINDLQSDIAKQTKEQVQTQLDELEGKLNSAKADLASLESELDLTNKLPEQGGLKGTPGVVDKRNSLKARIVDAKAMVQKQQENLNSFNSLYMFRFGAAISAQDKEKAKSDLQDLENNLEILRTEVNAIKNAMKEQQRAYDARAGSDMTFEQYAEATYQRPYDQSMAARYGTNSPAERAWGEFKDTMGTYSQHEGAWKQGGSSDAFAGFGNLSEDYIESDGTWSGASSSDAWDKVTTGFSAKKPDMPKFRE